MWCAETLVLTRWAHDRDGMPFASRAFATCAKAAFKPKKAGLVMTLKVYHLAWLEHVVSDCVLYWEARKGRLSNSAGGNAHVVDELKVLVKEAVERAIRIGNPEYDGGARSVDLGAPWPAHLCVRPGAHEARGRHRAARHRRG
ncbi:unnamed protein product [Closterium sp. NIES-64]|nr:unnamed protein product [Closterium sp. NIES-64]